MKVDSVSNSNALIKRLKTKKVAEGFSLPSGLDDIEEELDSIITSQKIPSFNPFLSLQEVSENNYETSDAAKLLSEGEEIIKNLNNIRLGLINGDLNEQNIRTLKEIIEKQKLRFNTAEARVLYDEIYLRASVELAKLERSKKT